MDECMVLLFYNSRHDCDNLVGGFTKLFLDTLKQERDNGRITKKGYIYDDSKAYLKGVASFPDTNLPLNTFEIIVLKLK